MPDGQGRLNRAEMREAIYRNINGLLRLTDPTTGDETGAATYDPLFSTKDLNRFIDTAITDAYLAMIESSETVFEDVEYIDVEKDVVEYSLPEDMCHLRSLWWKPDGVTFTQQPPNDRYLMYEADEPDYIDSAPSYRRRLNFIVLNTPPDRDNQGAIEVRYIKWILPLMTDEVVLETEFARILQEVVVLDASVQALSRKSGLDTTELRTDLTRWQGKLALAVASSSQPSFMFIKTRSHPFERARYEYARLWRRP